MPLAIFPTILGYFCTINAVNNIKASSVQLLEIAEPVFSIVLAYFILFETLSFNEVLGAIIILCGLVVFQSRVVEHAAAVCLKWKSGSVKACRCDSE